MTPPAFKFVAGATPLASAGSVGAGGTLGQPLVLDRQTKGRRWIEQGDTWPLIVFEGDSITSLTGLGDGAGHFTKWVSEQRGYSSQAVALVGAALAKAHIVNIARSGSSLNAQPNTNDLNLRNTARLAYRDAYLDAQVKRILAGFIGTNDIGGYGGDGVVMGNDILDYLDSAHAAGFTDVAWGTVPAPFGTGIGQRGFVPLSGSGELQRQACNAHLIAGASSRSWLRIVNLEAVTTGLLWDARDFLHYAESGHGKIAVPFAAAFTAILAA